MITRRDFALAAGATMLAAPAWPAPPAAGAASLPRHLDESRDLKLTRPDKQKTTLGAELGERRPLVVSLWATWCLPCLYETKLLAVARAQVRPEKLDIIGINIDKRPNDRAITKFLSWAPANYTQLRGREKETWKAFGGGHPSVYLPRLCIFARDGRPLHAFAGYDPEKMTDEVVAAMNEAIET